MRVLAIIPARGGSKGVPRKNIYPVCGKPLICYSIEPALEAVKMGLIDRLIVSTDDEEIAEISRQSGAEVPFMRPDYLSSDKAKSVDFMIHAYEFFKEKGDVYDTILLLQPTSPQRTTEDINNSINLFARLGVTSLVSCYKEESVSEYNSYHIEGNLAIPLHEDHNKGKRRQDLPDLYVRNGAIFITTVKQMITNHRVIDDVPAIYVMPRDRSINIDCMDDIELFQWKLSKMTTNL